MYKVDKSDTVNTLIRVKKDGTEIPVLQVINTPDKRLLIVDKYKVKSLRFKSDKPVKLVQAGNSYTAIVESTLQVFRLPHYIAYENEIQANNRSMLHLSTARIMQQLPEIRDSMVIDYEGILENMLEFIGEL